METLPKHMDEQIALERDEGSPVGHSQPYIFSSFGRKLQQRFGKFLADREEAGGSSTNSPTVAPLALGTGDPAGSLVRAAVSRIPFFYIRSSPKAKKRTCDGQIPILLSLLALRVIATENAFVFHLQYGHALHWTIRRRAMDIVRLHYLLQWRHLNGQLPAIPRLLTLRNVLKSSDQLTIAQIQAYFAALFSALDGCFGCVEVCEFLEISATSISRPDVAHAGLPAAKPLEGYLRCAVKSDAPEISGPKHLLALLTPRRIVYANLWVVLRSDCILLAAGPHRPPSHVILADQFLKIGVRNEYSRSLSRHFKPFTITVFHGHGKRLKIRPEGRACVQHWLERLRELAAGSEWCQPHRFASFAPVRTMAAHQLEWLIDARQYYARLAQAIEAATTEIYIHGWWVSPELHLVRPSAQHPEYRLDRLLKRKAEQGVQVHILVFKEIAMTLSINSLHTKNTLQKLHPNIRVLRHPDHYATGILLWAHHDKLVVVDQSTAFVGGLDLCHGRFDSPDHQLSDQGMGLWTGLEYANPRVREYRTVTNPAKDVVDARLIPRMPWHDVQMRVQGQVAGDLARHFISRWNFVRAEKGALHFPVLLPDTATRHPAHVGGDAVRMQAVRCASVWSSGVALDNSLCDAIIAIIANAKASVYIENQFFISSAAGHEASAIKNKVAAAIAARVIAAHAARAVFRVYLVLPLLPAFEAPLERPEATTCRIVMQAQYNTLNRGPRSLFGVLRAAGIADPAQYVRVYSLRKHGRMDGRLVTEQIYVHSKIAIVDDEIAMIGSANINDRSLLGGRDSEVGCVVEGRAAVGQLRKQLLAEHLGMAPADALLDKGLEDCELAAFIQQRAAANTEAFRFLFGCLPDDCVRTWAEYRHSMALQGAVSEALTPAQFSALSAIRGNLVLFPMEFLSQEDLTASIFSREFLLPIEVYI